MSKFFKYQNIILASFLCAIFMFGSAPAYAECKDKKKTAKLCVGENYCYKNGENHRWPDGNNCPDGYELKTVNNPDDACVQASFFATPYPCFSGCESAGVEVIEESQDSKCCSSTKERNCVGD